MQIRNDPVNYRVLKRDSKSRIETMSTINCCISIECRIEIIGTLNRTFPPPFDSFQRWLPVAIEMLGIKTIENVV